jgi:hypothetical protein
MKVLFSVIEYGSIVLQSLLLFSLLLRSNYRRYPLLLVYSVVVLAATVAEVLVVNALGTSSMGYRNLYMADEVIVDLLLFLMVIVMTYQAMGENPLRAKIGRLLGIVVAGVVLLPFVLFRGPIFGLRWFYETSQMLNFGGAIMNLALWTALLGNKKRDPLLLSVSAGLGVAVTGAAITYGLFHFQWATSGTARDLVNLIKSLAYLVSLVIWCWTFRPLPRPQISPPHPVTSP